MLNGSTVAAVGLALLDSGLLSLSQAYLVVAGSRLGAAFIVVMIGAVEYFQGKSESLRDSCSVGILAFLITYTTYVPGILAGYYALNRFELGFLEVVGPKAVQYSIGALFAPAVETASNALGSGGGLLFAILLMFFSLKHFDMAFAGLGERKIRSNYIRFLLSNRWYSFIAGAVLTLVTTSVALSLGIIVPLYNRGYIKRKEIIPYMMGANITTLADTVMAAIVLETSLGMKALLVLAISSSVFTILALVFYRQYFYLLKTTFDAIVTDSRVLGAFVLSLTLVPLLLFVI